MRTIKFQFRSLRNRDRSALWYYFKGAILSFFFILFSELLRLPGIRFHFKSAFFGLRGYAKGKLGRCKAYLLVFYPIDATRYFEFDFFWKAIRKNASLGRYLDMSSPRLFPVVLLDAYPDLIADINNPDIKDLETTKELVNACGFLARCHFSSNLVEQLSGCCEIYDTITSISVIEHLPGNGDYEAVLILWKLLKPGGRLFISLPCCKEPLDEYLNVDQFGLLKPEEDNFYFSQRYYNESLLERKIFEITGRPVASVIYGERKAGTFWENREEKNCDCNYPFWKEPYFAYRNFSKYRSIEELPGIGVVVMEFVKPSNNGLE